jgi:hypothetical protein
VIAAYAHQSEVVRSHPVPSPPSAGERARERGAFFRAVATLLSCSLFCDITFAEEEPTKPADLAEARLEVMRARAQSIVFVSGEPGFPTRLEPAPLFRYDDETRGYVDGTVWRLGKEGRPLALITTELHPRYLGEKPRVVYDFLSLTERSFNARSADVPGWSPSGSAVEFHRLPNAPAPSTVAATRLSQLKQQARRFSATQEVSELDTTFVHLRLLPREINHYVPDERPRSDGAMFLLVNGRNPALVLLIETDGQDWRYGIGRLSTPSNLSVRLDDVVVWAQPKAALGWAKPYTASNSAATFP